MPQVLGAPMTTPSSYCVAVLCLALTACAGGTHTSKETGEKTVSRVDERGTKPFVHETDTNGQTKIHDTSAPAAKRRSSAQGTSDRVRAKKSAPVATLSVTTIRQPDDPIYVNLTAPVLDDKMQQVEKAKGAVAQQIRSEFASDPVIKLVAGSLDTAREKPRATPSLADVEVSSKVSIKEVYGLNSKTGKPGKMVAVVYEATITSQIPHATYTISETGDVLKNAEVSKRFARQVRQVIVEKIGPSIPAN